MDTVKKRTPDYTDIAYREAVARLRYLLAESYSSPQATPTKIPHVHMTKAEDSGDETDASMVMSERSRHVPYRTPYFGSKRALYSESLPKLSQTCSSTLNVPGVTDTAENASLQHPPPELMAFIERQEEYIEQLEKESQYCREELSNLLGRVKDVISENEGLHEREKSGLLKSVFDCFESGDEDDQDMEQEKQERRKPQPYKKKRLEGPSIIFESRISELEAQLTQTKIDLRKAQEESDLYKKKLTDIQPYSSELSSSLPNVESYRQQIDTLLREKEDLADKLAKLNTAVTQIREKEADASHKVKRSLDVVDQAQFEKAQEQGRRVVEERTQAERRYAQQVEQLSAELTVQWDAASKLQLELEKQRRTETDLRRELQQKTATIEELKKELLTKIAGLQGEATQSAAERGSLEQELAASRLTAERAERDARQESTRLQAEVAALRQRLDRTDSDLLHSRRENLRLSEQVAGLEREVSLAKMMREGSGQGSSDGPKSSSSPTKHREKELSSMIMDMEAKHVQTVAELESMIQSQNQVVEKLKDECHSLTEKLEDSSARHKGEKSNFKEQNAVLMDKLEQVWTNCKELQRQCLVLGGGSGGQTARPNEQTTPMLRSAGQDLSMAFNLSNSNRNTSPNQSMVHSNLFITHSSQPLNQKNLATMHNSQSTTHSNPNTNHSLNTAHNPSMIHSSTCTNRSPAMKLDKNLSQTMSLNLDLSPKNQVVYHSQPSSPSQVLDTNPVWSPSHFPTPNRVSNHSSSARPSPSHPPLSPRRREVGHPLLTLEDLATDSDAGQSLSAQHDIFR